MPEIPYLRDLAAMKNVDPDVLLTAIKEITGPDNAAAGVRKLYDAWVSITNAKR